MGVLGLWQILESVGHPIKLEGLEGKRLGVDANVWLYKFIRGFRDKDNAATLDSHKLGLFNRICKLLFYKIKPVFVFDGPAPALKRRTLERRQNTRSKHLMKVQGAAMKILADQLKRQYPDAKLDDLTIQVPQFNSNGLVAAEKLTDEDASLFYLPPEKPRKEDERSSDESHDEVEVYNFASTSKWRQQDLKIDVESKEFKNMPAEVRYEILQDLKEDRKRIRNSGTLPDDAESFSNFQLNRLKARRSIQEKIEECEKDICSIYTGECDGRSISSYRMQSDPTSRMIYIQNQGKSEGSQILSATSSFSRASKIFEEQSKINATTVAIEIPERSSQREEPSSIANPATLVDHDSATSSRIVSEVATKIVDSNKLVAAEELTDGDASLYCLSTEHDTKEQNKSSDESDDVIEVFYSATSSKGQEQESKIDVESKSMPAEVRYEISQDLKEDRKRIRNSSTLPDDVESFSDYQQSRLRGRRSIQEDVEECEKDISSIHTSDCDGRLSPRTFQSDPTTKMIHIQDQEKSKRSQARSATSSFFQASEIREKQSKMDATAETIEILEESLQREDPSSIANEDASLYCLSTEHDTKEQKKSSDESDDVVEVFYSATSSKGQEQESKIDIESKSMPAEASKNLEQQTDGQRTEAVEVPIEYSQGGPSIIANLATLADHDSATSNRMANKVTSRIIEESKELLRLFGIPYVDAAGEAEAQCALLEELNLTEGTITDDSDIWLFGAKNVYRYFFSDDKYVMQYKLNDIEFHLRLTRQELVCFAMLVGSDYTDGIMNVGPVNALEIISEFPGNGMEPLINFKKWRDAHTKKSEVKVKHRKFLKFQLPEGFPSRTVFEGYMRPVADTSTEQFSWGVPDLDELREYARRNFGWDIRKIDEKLLPVMKKLSERKTQPTIDSFFFKTAANQNPELFRSKRVNQALSKLAKQDDVVMLSEDDEDDHNESGQEDNDAAVAKKNTSKKAIRGSGARKNTANHGTKARAAGKSRPKSGSANKPKRQRRTNKDA